MRPSKKRFVAFAAAVVALTLVSGSWAFFSAENNIENTMKTDSYGDVLRETFTPDGDWRPGDTTVKEVGVDNIGDYDLVVRVKMEEGWAYNDTPDTQFITLNTASTDFSPDSAENGTQTNADDGLTTGDGSVVFKNTDFGSWVKDGEWYYYKNILHSNSSTGNFLNSITLCGDTDMGLKTNTYYYTTNENLADVIPDGENTSASAADRATKWVRLGATDDYPDDLGTAYFYNTSGISSSARGYADAEYVLIITAQTCAAEPDAVSAAWGADALNLGTDWSF